MVRFFCHCCAHAGVGFDALIAAVQEILGQVDGSRFKEEDGRRAAEGEVAFFLAFLDGGVCGVGLEDGADAGGADFEHDYGAAIRSLDFTDRAFVLPKVAEVLAKCDRRYGEEGAVDAACGGGFSGNGEVKAVIIYGAESREDEGARLVAGGEFFIAEEACDVEALAFDEDGVDF